MMRRLAAVVALLAWSAAASPEGSGGSGDWFYLVRSKPTDPAREAEYNAWYDDIDIPDVLEVPGFMRARRAVAVTGTGSGGNSAREPKARYAALYDIESADIDKTIIDLYVAARKMSALGRLTDVLEVVEANYYRKIGGRGTGPNDHEDHFLYTQKILCCETEAERERFAAWYDERASTAVARIDGFRQSGLYELYRIMEVLTVPEEEIPHFLIVHEFAGVAARDIEPRLRDAIGQLESAGRLDDGYRPGESVLYRLMSDVRAEAEEVRGEAGGDWPTYGGPPSATQYSSLAQISLETIDGLDVAWVYHTGEISYGEETVDATVSQVTPIYANEKLYLCTPFNHVVALDPASGAELWRFDPKKPKTGTMYGSHNCRGVAYWEAPTTEEKSRFCGKRIFEAVGHGVLVAVDANSGQPCRRFGENGRIDLNALDYKGEGRLDASSPPAIFRDVVIVGGMVIDNKYRDSLDGIVRGFDARDGGERWSFNPIPAHLSDKTGGANTWAPMSVDTERGWVFLPTGSPSYDVLGVNRREEVPFGNAVIALNALSGEVIWSYQTVHHDLWDYDLPSAPTLIDVARNGETVPAVLQATKTGFVFLLDRRTGEPLFPVYERPAPRSDVPGEFSSPTQPIPSLPLPVASQSISADDAWGALVLDRKACRERLAGLRNEGLYTPPGIEGSVLHPSFLGGSNWGGIAYDPESGLAVVNASNMVASVTLVPREQYDPEKHLREGVSFYEMRDSPYVLLREVLLSPLGAPCNPPPWGTLTAIDMRSGETRWQVPFGRIQLAGPIKSPASWGAPNQGGPIITAGGLVFIGASLDSRFRAYDLRTGEEVWSAAVPAPATATPMTYRHGERQYVVVAAGGHGAFGTRLSDSIVAFALPAG